MTITVIGTGLIGCSMANRLKETGFAQKIIGADISVRNIKTALELGWIDEAMAIDKAIPGSDLIIIAIPVDATLQLLTGSLEKLDKKRHMDVV